MRIKPRCGKQRFKSTRVAALKCINEDRYSLDGRVKRFQLAYCTTVVANDYYCRV